MTSQPPATAHHSEAPNDEHHCADTSLAFAAQPLSLNARSCSRVSLSSSPPPSPPLAAAAACASPPANAQLDLSRIVASHRADDEEDAAAATPPPSLESDSSEMADTNSPVPAAEAPGVQSPRSPPHPRQLGSPPPLMPFDNSPPMDPLLSASSPEEALQQLLPLPFPAMATGADEEAPIAAFGAVDSQEMYCDDFLLPATDAAANEAEHGAAASVRADSHATEDAAAADDQPLPALTPLEPHAVPLQQSHRIRRGRGGRPVGRVQSHVAVVLARLRAEAARQSEILESQQTESELSDDEDEQGCTHRRGVSFAPLLEQHCLFHSHEGTDQLSVQPSVPGGGCETDEMSDDGAAAAAFPALASAVDVAAAAAAASASSDPTVPATGASPTSDAPSPLSSSPSPAPVAVESPSSVSDIRPLRSILKRRRVVEETEEGAATSAVQEQGGGNSAISSPPPAPVSPHESLPLRARSSGGSSTQIHANMRMADEPLQEPMAKRQRRGHQIVSAVQQSAAAAAAASFCPVAAADQAISAPAGECDMSFSLQQLIYPGSMFSATAASESRTTAADEQSEHKEQQMPQLPPPAFAAAAAAAAAAVSSAARTSPPPIPPLASPQGTPPMEIEFALRQQAAWQRSWSGGTHERTQAMSQCF